MYVRTYRYWVFFFIQRQRMQLQEFIQQVILRALEASKMVNKKIASLQEEATHDVLMLNHSYRDEMLYKWIVQKGSSSITQGLEERSTIVATEEERVKLPPSYNYSKMQMGNLVDGYLSEIMSNDNLRSNKFCSLALALLYHMQLFDIGLYEFAYVNLKVVSDFVGPLGYGALQGPWWGLIEIPVMD